MKRRVYTLLAVIVWLMCLVACGVDRTTFPVVAVPTVVERPTITPLNTPKPKVGWWSTLAAPDAPFALATLNRGNLASGRFTPTPTVDPDSYKTGILFRSKREGGFDALWIMDEDGSNPRKLRVAGDDYFGRQSEAFYRAALAKQLQSPDGAWRVYVNTSLQLGVQRMSDGRIWQLTHFGAGLAYEPAWSPRGDSVALVSNDSSLDEIWVVPADPNLWGDNATMKQITYSQWESNKHPTWSPDGKRIAFWSNREGHKQIYVMNADGSNIANLSRSRYDDYDPVWLR